MLLSSPKAWRRRSRALSCNSADWNSYLMLSHVLEGLVKGKSACFSIHAMYCTLRQSLSVKGYCCQGGGIPVGLFVTSTLGLHQTIKFGSVFEPDDAAFVALIRSPPFMVTLCPFLLQRRPTLNTEYLC